MCYRIKYKMVKIAVSPEIWAALNEAHMMSLQSLSERGVEVDFKLLKSLSRWHPDLNGYVNSAMIRLIHFYVSMEKSSKKCGRPNKYAEMRKIMVDLRKALKPSVS